MSSNVLDEVIALVRKTWNDVGFALSPTSLAVTLFVLLLPFLLILIFALTQKDDPLPPPSGCRRIGLNGPSNLSDQYDKIYSQGADPSPSNPYKVKAVFIYPIKSCAGIELDQSEVVRTGLKYDRQFCLGQYVTGLPSLQGKVESDWNFITQRTFPRLAKVETEIWVPDSKAPGYTENAEYVKSEGCLVIRFPFSPDTEFSLDGLRAYGKILAAKLQGKSEPMVEFRVPFNSPKDRIRKMKYKSEKVKIWKDAPEALNISPEVPSEIMAKLAYTLGVSNQLSLFRIDTEKYREVFMCAPKKQDVGFQPIIGMADSYPMHVMNLASVHHVANELPRANKFKDRFNALRYRANIYFTGPPAFAEDSWTRARIGGQEYHISCRTTRCKLPNVDPETGIADRNEPGTTMRKYRVIDQGSNSPCLGMQVTPLTDGEVKVGDEVEVLEIGEHFFRKE
ncbi:MOSC domain-containing protein [Lophiotrema nucula]|uniref:MOSC domain-containing protein n=1 Tax=Lophiotrema nucula TaxID=690887 RepID=A0A6A5Z2R5_9PLEO|nr:MOSC domain-containing protein [Lophiotrema nucula]